MRFYILCLLSISSLLAGCIKHFQQESELAALQKVNIFSIQKDNTSVLLNGTINSRALTDFKRLLEQYPNIKTLNIKNCDGSIDDEVNLQLGKLIFDYNINTHILANGDIASGGTDLFLAGNKRSKGENTRIGVHAWAEGFDGISATSISKQDPRHLPYIHYYQYVGMDQRAASAFYYFTINAAPAEDIHWMTAAEIKKYHIITE